MAVSDDPDEIQAVPVPSQKARVVKLLLGIILVLGIAVSITGTTQFARNTYSEEFKAPFFVTWFNAIWLVVCYPVCFLVMLLHYRGKESMGEMWRRSQTVYGQSGLTLTKFFTHGGCFAVVAMATNYAYIRAFSFTNVSDVTALFASNCVFVFLLSCLLLNARFISLKLISVVLAVAGIVLIMYAEGFTKPGGIAVFLAMFSAFGAACYTVMFKRLVGNATPDQVALFLSVVALFTAIFFWPVFLILHFMKVEIVTAKYIPWENMLCSASLSVVFNYLINFGVAFTYPLFIAFGGIFAIPLNQTADFFFRNVAFTWTKTTGTILIILAFIVIVALPEAIDERFHAAVTGYGKKKEKSRKNNQTSEEMEQLNKHRDDLKDTA